MKEAESAGNDEIDEYSEEVVDLREEIVAAEDNDWDEGLEREEDDDDNKEDDQGELMETEPQDVLGEE